MLHSNQRISCFVLIKLLCLALNLGIECAFFDYNSSQLLPGGYREIARIASVLNKYQQTQIEVGGHTDSTGSEYYNRQLSMRRAEAVKNALIQQGVAPSRINAVGYGESHPISSSRAMNRRVEIVIIPVNRY